MIRTWEDVPGWFSVQEANLLRQALLSLKPGSTIVEIGVWFGRSLAFMAENAPGHASLFGVDSYRRDSQAVIESRFSASLAQMFAQELIDNVLQARVPRGTVVSLWPRSSADAARELALGDIALLHIDGHHSQNMLRCDLDAWLPRTGPGAWLAIHDFNNPTFKLYEVLQQDEYTKNWDLIDIQGSLGLWRKRD